MKQVPHRPPILESRELSREYHLVRQTTNKIIRKKSRKSFNAVDRVSFHIRQGEIFGLVGESGSGKTTLARLCVGLIRPTHGSVSFKGHDVIRIASDRRLSPMRRKLQLVFQNPYASLNPRRQLIEIVGAPIRAFKIADNKTQLKDLVLRLLLEVGLSEEDGSKYPHQCSGGQRQRIAIARALASQPELIVFDEPTSALDVSVQAQILNLIKRKKKEYDLTYIIISHDLSVISSLADRIGVMYRGKLVEIGDIVHSLSELRHPYSRSLLSSVLRLRPCELTFANNLHVSVDEAARDTRPLNIQEEPLGCNYYSNCPYATEKCAMLMPSLKNYGNRSIIACHAAEDGRI